MEKSKYACNDNEAIYLKTKENKFLPNFFNDVDEIINSAAYTRYMGKPQVFTQNTHDHIANRMIHVQLVNQVARTIGRGLGLNEDLIEAAALGHDLGHVPYGHEGEYILNDISLENGEGHYNHNVGSVRRLLFLENHGLGLNVSVQVLDAILCHNSKSSMPVYEPCEKTVEQFFYEYYNSYRDKNSLNIIRPMTLEGCVIRISDLIAYLGRDIDDAIRYGIFSWDKVPSDILNVLGYSRRELINTCVKDIIKNSYGKPYIALSDQVYEALMKLLKINTQNIYKNYLAPGEKEFYKKMYNYLFDSYVRDLTDQNKDSLIVKYFYSMTPEYQKETSKKRVTIDFISGMTTNYFYQEYQTLIRKRK